MGWRGGLGPHWCGGLGPTTTCLVPSLCGEGGGTCGVANDFARDRGAEVIVIRITAARDRGAEVILNVRRAGCTATAPRSRATRWMSLNVRSAPEAEVITWTELKRALAVSTVEYDIIFIYVVLVLVLQQQQQQQQQHNGAT